MNKKIMSTIIIAVLVLSICTNIAAVSSSGRVENDANAEFSSSSDLPEAQQDGIQPEADLYVEEGEGNAPDTLIMDESPGGDVVVAPSKILTRSVRLPSATDRCRLTSKDEAMVLQKCIEIFERHSRHDLVEKWTDAKLSEAFLEYNVFFEKIQWIVSVLNDKTCVGTIALEINGDLAWVNPNEAISIEQSAYEAKKAIEKCLGSRMALRMQDLKLMTVKGSHCWFYENSKVTYLADVFTATVTEVTRAQLMAPTYTTDMAPGANTEIQPDTVPWFSQGGKPWCGMYSTTMALAWWGDSTAQTDEDACAWDLAIVAQGLDPPDTTHGAYIGTLEYAAKDLVFPMLGTWHGEMKTIWASDGVAPYYYNDIKDCISSNGLIVCIEVDCDGSKTTTNDLHVVVIIGYDDSATTVYVHDPSGAWTWAGGDTWASYSNLETHWGTYDADGGFWDRDTPGLTWTHRHKHLGMVIYPGRNDPPTAEAYLTAPPASMIETQAVTLTATLICRNWNTQNGGLFIWADGGEITSCSTADFTVYPYDTSANPISLPAPIVELRRGYTTIDISYTAQVTIKPKGPGLMRIYYRGWGTAWYDFVHCNYDFSKVNPWQTRLHVTTVSDDSAESPISMPRPENWIARDPSSWADDRYEGSYKFTWYSKYHYDVTVTKHSEVAVIVPGLTVDDSVLKALDALGYSYDYFYKSFPADYKPYKSIIQAMDGGTTTQIPQLADYIQGGGRAIVLGGSSLASFVQDVNTYLMGVNTTYYPWKQVGASPHIQIVDLSHPLARGLPVTYNFNDSRATYYMLRITDPVPSVVAMNGDGYKTIVKKKLGNGTLTWFINSPSQTYWADSGDYSYLKTFLGNALSVDIAVISVCAATVENSVLKMLRELGYEYDHYYVPCSPDPTDFPKDYNRYEIIIQVMDGGYEHQISKLSQFINNGGRAILFGGSNWKPFVENVSTYLMSVNTTYHSWKISGTPHITIVDPDHPLAKDLPATYNFVSSVAAYYMLRITDPVPHVVAVNGDGYKAIVTKKLGYGRFTYYIHLAEEWAITDPADYNYLKTFLRNALKPADIAVVTTTAISGSVLKAIDELGYTYDCYSISGIPASYPSRYELYKVVVQAMDGGTVLDIPRLAYYARRGGQVILLGGSNWKPFAEDVNDYLMGINTAYHSWVTVSGTPHITIVDSAHWLARDLPTTYNFNSIYATYYMLRITEARPHVVAVNGDGYKAIVTKRLGYGRFSWFINSPYQGYWTYAKDYSYLKTFLRNALRPLGDVNNDHYVNQMDLALISEALWTKKGDPGYNPDADLNGDGVIDLDDIKLCIDGWTHFLFD